MYEYVKINIRDCIKKIVSLLWDRIRFDKKNCRLYAWHKPLIWLQTQITSYVTSLLCTLSALFPASAVKTFWRAQSRSMSNHLLVFRSESCHVMPYTIITASACLQYGKTRLWNRSRPEVSFTANLTPLPWSW